MSHIVSAQTQVEDAAAVRTACQRLGLPAPVQGTTKRFSGEATGLAVQLAPIGSGTWMMYRHFRSSRRIDRRGHSTGRIARRGRRCVGARQSLRNRHRSKVVDFGDRLSVECSKDIVRTTDTLSRRGIIAIFHIFG